MSTGRTPRRRPPALVVAAGAVLGILLAGCGAGQPTGPGSTPVTATTGSTAPSSPAPSDSPTRSLSASQVIPGSTASDSAAPGEDETLRGRVQDGVESGCVVLVDESGVVLANLIGFDATGVDVSGVVEVTGSFNADLMTICQQGRPFEVASVRAS
jgi:hypothetical protein